MATRLPISPFIDETMPRFKLDEGAFMAELAEELAGLTLGRDDLLPGEMAPVLEVLAAY
jgi:hypothetical protein